MRRLLALPAAVALADCHAYQRHRLVDIAEHPARAFGSRYFWVLLGVLVSAALLGLVVWLRKRPYR